MLDRYLIYQFTLAPIPRHRIPFVFTAVHVSFINKLGFIRLFNEVPKTIRKL